MQLNLLSAIKGDWTKVRLCVCVFAGWLAGEGSPLGLGPQGRPCGALVRACVCASASSCAFVRPSARSFFGSFVCVPRLRTCSQCTHTRATTTGGPATQSEAQPSSAQPRRHRALMFHLILLFWQYQKFPLFPTHSQTQTR